MPSRGKTKRSMRDSQSLPCLGVRQPGRICARTASAAAAKVGMLLRRPLGQRIASGAGEPAVGEGSCAGLLERDEQETAESGFAASSADDEPLYSAAGVPVGCTSR